MDAMLRGLSPFGAAVSYLARFLRDDAMLGGYRRRCYIAGAVICLSADALCPGWRDEWPCSDIPIYDWLAERLGLSEKTEAVLSDDVLAEAETLLSAHQIEQERVIAEFMDQPLEYIDGVSLIGFDPMNMTCAGGRCLHKSGKALAGGGEILLGFPFVAEYGGTIVDVDHIWVPKGKEALFHAADD
jgi:hypothetical protein